MKRRAFLHRWPGWMGLGLALCSGYALPRACAQRYVEPRWVRFQLYNLAVGLDLERESQERDSRFARFTQTSERFYVAPVLELGARGSIYHPNLLEYDLFGENNFAYDDHSIRDPSSGRKQSQTGFDYLLRYQFNARVLKAKPYATSLFAGKGRTFRNLDFFTRTTVDTETYGGATGYRNDVVPVTVSYRHWSEDESGLARPTSRVEDTLDVVATNERDYGGKTAVDYTYGLFDRRNFGIARDVGDSHTATLTDTEPFGKDDWARLRSYLRYYLVDSTGRQEDSFQATENLTLDHSDTLQSFYNYTFDTRRSGRTRNTGHLGTATVQHQLYKSLTSRLELRAEDLVTTSPGSQLDVFRYGGILSESYSKRLSDQAHLNLGYSLRVQPERQDFRGGDVVVLGESHRLEDNQITFLNLPNIKRNTVRVTDETGTFLYTEGLDYLLFPRGNLTEIRRVAGGRIPNGATVLVDYVAAGQPSDSFVTLLNSVTWRISLWDRLLAVYGRLTFDDKLGGELLVLNRYADYLFGVESEWRWLQLGAEYENYDSNLTPFEAVRFRQGASWDPYSALGLSLNLSQTFTDFPDNDRRVNYYDFIARIETRPWPFLFWTVEGGYRVEKGDGVDQVLGTARTSLDFVMGKLKAQVTYQYQTETFFSDEYRRHYLYFNMRRSF